MRKHIEEETIALLAGGDLAPEKMRAATIHMAHCSACSALLENYRSSRGAWVIIRDAGINEGDFAHIRRSVMECLPAKTGHPIRNFRWPQLSPVQYGILAAVLLAALMIGIQMSSERPEPQLSNNVAREEVSPRASIPPSPGMSMDSDPIAVTAEASAQNTVAQARERSQVKTVATVLPAAAAFVEPQTPPSQATLPDDVAIKLETSDPNVIIIWLASPKGAGR